VSESNQAPAREFNLLRIYTKDVSFEAPGAPAVFTEQWDPNFNLNLNSEVTNLENDRYEVVLTGTVTCKAGDKTAYLVEVKQAGVFAMRGFPKEEMGPMLGAYCPNILFPFLREVVADLVNKGSFPQLLLTPVNFEALYAQHLHNQRMQQQAAQEKTADATTH